MSEELTYYEKKIECFKTMYLDHPFSYNGKKIETMYKLQKIVTNDEILHELVDNLSDFECSCITNWLHFDKYYVETDEIRKK